MFLHWTTHKSVEWGSRLYVTWCICGLQRLTLYYLLSFWNVCNQSCRERFIIDYKCSDYYPRKQKNKKKKKRVHSRSSYHHGRSYDILTRHGFKRWTTSCCFYLQEHIQLNFSNPCDRRLSGQPQEHPVADARETRAAWPSAFETTMEKDVGSLQDQALKRKERLKALREKQLHVSFMFRSYAWSLGNETRALFDRRCRSCC